MLSGTTAFGTTAPGAWLRLDLHPPGGKSLPAGVLLLDEATDQLYVRLRPEWPDSLDPEDREILAAIAEDFARRARREPGGALLASLEDSFSHLLRLSPRQSITVEDPAAQLNRLYTSEVEGGLAPLREAIRSGASKLAESIREAIPRVDFVTHLPFVPIHLTAGAFDGDAEVAEIAEDWLPLPAGLREGKPHREYFIARVTGHSMEPQIPDGSFCLFRYNPQGSREGKWVLAQKYGSSQSGGAFSIKKYHSEKVTERPEGGDEYADTEWRHARVRLISLNPDYPSWDLDPDQCRILAEFVRILDDDEVPEKLRAE